jgi:outer membrane protein
MKCSLTILWMLVLLSTLVPAAAGSVDNPYSLEACIDIALKNNQRQQISRLAVETAEAQLQQALSSYWPQVSFQSGYNRLDEELNFIFPEETSQYTISGIGQDPITTTVNIPAKDITVIERDNLLSRLNLMMPIFTGGMRPAVVRQAKAGVEAAQHARKRTQLELIHDVKRFYFGAILARQVSSIGDDAFKRLKTTVELTETLYQGGSSSVSKRDYLRSKMALDYARSIVTTLQTNVALAESALGNTMGMAWDKLVKPADNEIPYTPVGSDLKKMVAGAYRFNPDWLQLEAAIKAYEAKVDEQKAERWPIIGVTGTLWRWDHKMDNSGAGTDQNSEGWSVGVGLEVPLFKGFLTTNKIKAARLALEAMEARQLLFKEGLGLLLKHAFLEMEQARNVHEASKSAADNAVEHRDLTERAYRHEMVETSDLIEAQVIEALALANAQKALYSHAKARFQVDFLVGQEITRFFE